MIIEELEVPDVATADWIAMVGVRNSVKVEAVGTSDLSIEPDELLPRWQNPHERKRAVLARVDGEVVGRGASSHTPPSRAHRTDSTP
jgi:hypothetical protein